MCHRPKEDCTRRVQAQTHQDGELVTLALHDFCCDWRKAEVTTTEIHDLEAGRLETRDAKYILKVLVEHVKKTVRETPEEEERRDHDNRENQGPAGQVATLNGGRV